MRLNQLRVKLLAVLLAVLAVGAWNYTRVPYIQAAASEDDSTSIPISAVSVADGYILKVFDEQVGCRNLTPQEAASLAERDPKVRLHVISPIRPLAAAGLRITLRATLQFVSPSAIFRVLGIIPAVADPDGERDEGLGDPPAIGFNSRFTFDFDPNDGVDADKFDFDAIASHEIGHVLGFTSAIERSESSPRAVSILDLFRFRPGVMLEAFTHAKRVLTEGGEHVFFAGDTELPLSSGRSEEMGADGLQAGHWKARRFIGVYIGIMVPEIARGERQVITGNDLEAYDTFGYRLAARASSLQQF